jgi:hypothetical protein
MNESTRNSGGITGKIKVMPSGEKAKKDCKEKF